MSFKPVTVLIRIFRKELAKLKMAKPPEDFLKAKIEIRNKPQKFLETYFGF